MSKSQIIKDIANGKSDVHTSLKRLKVLLINFNKPELLKWIDNEINGYPEDVNLPTYRITAGQIKGNFWVGHMHYQHSVIPITGLNLEDRKLFTSINIRESVGSIRDLLNSEKGTFSVPLPDISFPILQSSSNIISINLAYKEFGRSDLVDMLNIIDNKILDILLLLEKEFGNLDDLDIDIQDKTKNGILFIENQILQIIFDNSISIGDNNKIKDTDIKTD